MIGAFGPWPGTIKQEEEKKEKSEVETKKPEETINCCQKGLWSRCFISKGKAPICEFYHPAIDNYLRCRDMRPADGDLYCACLEAQIDRRGNSITDERLKEKIGEIIRKYDSSA